MARKSKKKSAKVNYKEILITALADLAIGALLIVLDKILN